MLRAGLALAGARRWLAGGCLPEEAEDGLLMAEDVLGMDLRGTELVVLSGCDTGRGDVHVGEGVFGLQRAFMLAGARSLVTTLWNVPDEETQAIMVHFYRVLLSGRPRSEALRSAQLRLREECPHPFYWAAFVLQGDPGPITGPIAAG